MSKCFYPGRRRRVKNPLLHRAIDQRCKDLCDQHSDVIKKIKYEGKEQQQSAVVEGGEKFVNADLNKY